MYPSFRKASFGHDIPPSFMVQTTYFGPTDTRGARIRARPIGVRSGGKTYGYQHQLAHLDNHAEAARAFVKVSGWRIDPCDITAYASAGQLGYVFVFVALPGVP